MSSIPAVAEGPVEYIYGDKDFSDVVHLVGGAELHAHKMILASRSPYFKVMFYGPFKERNQSRVAILDVDLKALCQMMEVIYDNNIITDKGVFMLCNHCSIFDHYQEQKNSAENIGNQQQLWLRSVALLEVADRFDVFNQTLAALENLFNWAHCRLKTNKEQCGQEEVRQLLALNYGMKRWKTVRRVPLQVIKETLRNLRPLKPNLNFSFDDLDWLLNEEEEKDDPIPSSSGTTSQSNVLANRILNDMDDFLNDEEMMADIEDAMNNRDFEWDF